MRPQVVHPAQIAWGQHGSQHRRDIGAQDLRLSRPLDGPHGVQAVDAQRPQPGDLLAVVLGRVPHAPLPCGGTPVPARHRPMHAR
jgi:hypothetical protein